ncbi:RidA family protein [Amycolatopsis sp. GM8]|uniref:RidA family protein n=1 Tax=Amycolatopsis sp. GM8 TaxID=2896530 RepID=UPI001F2BFB38|nr:RidA family protein [Amycolatopsis sp. GM8]
MTDASAHTFGFEAESAYGYCQSRRVGDTVYVSGQLAWDDDGNFVEGSFADQVERTFANIDRVLAHYGAGRQHIVQDFTVVVDLPVWFNDFSALHAAYYGEHRPASTICGVAALAFPGQLVEINAILALGA